jgi:Leucine-rich repeat (LRR) protein
MNESEKQLSFKRYGGCELLVQDVDALMDLEKLFGRKIAFGERKSNKRKLMRFYVRDKRVTALGLATQASMDRLNKQKASDELDLPASFANLDQLEHLLIHGRWYSPSSLNAVLPSLQKLRYLEFIGSIRFEIPEAIGKLANLEDLIILDSIIKEIPESIFELANLNRLIIGLIEKGMRKYYSNRKIISEVSESIGKLKKLEELSISGKFKSLPESIGELVNLKELSFDDSIEQLPDNISKLKKLKRLHLENNKIKDFQSIESILQLENLEYLNLSRNKIKFLPDSICKLRNLKKIAIRSTKLQEFPECLLHLPSLDLIEITWSPIDISFSEYLDKAYPNSSIVIL